MDSVKNLKFECCLALATSLIKFYLKEERKVFLKFEQTGTLQEDEKEAFERAIKSKIETFRQMFSNHFPDHSSVMHRELMLKLVKHLLEPYPFCQICLKRHDMEHYRYCRRPRKKKNYKKNPAKIVQFLHYFLLSCLYNNNFENVDIKVSYEETKMKNDLFNCLPCMPDCFHDNGNTHRMKRFSFCNEFDHNHDRFILSLCRMFSNKNIVGNLTVIMLCVNKYQGTKELFEAIGKNCHHLAEFFFKQHFKPSLAVTRNMQPSKIQVNQTI